MTASARRPAPEAEPVLHRRRDAPVRELATPPAARVNGHERPQELSDAGSRAGLPRPRAAGMPLPWITRVEGGAPAWARVDLARVLTCQTEWRCQVCGEHLQRQAWVVLETDRTVLSDAAMHYECMVMAYRWCPHLREPADELESLCVTLESIRTSRDCLEEIPQDGDEIRTWTVPAP